MFHVVQHADMPPYKCVCGNEFGPFVQTGLQLPYKVPVPGFHGLANANVYVCTRCLSQLAFTSGYASPGETQALLDETSALTAKVAKLETELEAERGSKVVSVAELKRELAVSRDAA